MRHGFLAAGLCAVLFGFAGTVFSQADSPSESVWRAHTLDRLAFSVNAQSQVRPMKAGEMSFDLETTDIWGEMSVDVTRWLTVGGGLGRTEVRRMGLGRDGDADRMWNVGAKLNIVEHKLRRPGFMESLLRLQTRVSHWDNRVSLRDVVSVEWEEFRAELTVRAEAFVKESGTYDEPVPYSAVFYAGPIYSKVKGKGRVPGAMEAGFNEADRSGAIFGLDVKLARNLSLGWETRIIGDAAHRIGLALHL